MFSVFENAMYFSATATMSSQPFFAAIALVLTASASAQPRFEHGWTEPRTWQDLSEVLPDEKVVVLHEYESYSVGDFLNSDGLPEGRGILTELHLVMEFRDKASLVRLDTGLIRIPLRAKVTHFDARILHANGTRTELSKQNCIVALDEHPYLSRYWQNLYLKDHKLEPGDQLEWILRTRMYGSNNLSERRVVVQWPTIHKELMVELQDEVPFHLVSQGEFPEVVEHRRADRTGWTWTFTDMRPLGYSPLLLDEFKTCRFSVMSMIHFGVGDLLANYDQQHPYIRFNGRPHVHDFVEHIEARRKSLGQVPNAEIFKDVVTFVHDSIQMIPDDALEVNRPIGAYFHDRRMTPERLVVLYRQLANVLEEPLYVGFTRDRYRRVIPFDEIRAENLDERFLAIRDPNTDGFLFITPNTLTQRYHFNELPYWISGQPAWLMPFTEDSEKDKDPITMVLPSPKPTDNSLAERIQLTYDRKTSSFRGKGRAVAVGQMRVAMETNDIMTDMPEHPTMQLLAGRYALKDSSRTTLNPEPRSMYYFTPTIQPLAIRGENSSGTVTTDLYPFLKLTTLEECGIPVTPGCMLPFPYQFRLDVHFDLPPDHSLLTTMRDTIMENSIGTVHYTFQRSPSGGCDWHLEHWISGLWLDEMNFDQYRDLMAFLHDRTYYNVQFNTTSLPATSPASPAGLGSDPR